MTREHEFNIQKDVLISGLLRLQEAHVLKFKLMFVPDVCLWASSFDWHLAGEETSHTAARREGTKKNCNLPCSVCFITFHVLPKLRRVGCSEVGIVTPLLHFFTRQHVKFRLKFHIAISYTVLLFGISKCWCVRQSKQKISPNLFCHKKFFLDWTAIVNKMKFFLI